MEWNNADLGNQWLAASGVADQDLPASALYVVATPIGNLADITLRALWTLARVDAIAAEDTRTSATLLDRFGLPRDGRLIAVHEHNEASAAARIIERLRAGERIALISDAGTPAISDPGARLVQAVVAAGLRVVPVPGASSVTAAVSAAGLTEGGFEFIGFLPIGKTERDKRLAAAVNRGHAFVLLEAPHRIEATLSALADVLSPPRAVIVARELTKKFESIDRVSSSELTAWLAVQPARGEYVLVVDAAEQPAAQLDESTRRWLAALASALPASRAAAVAAKATGLPRAVLYQALLPPGRDGRRDDADDANEAAAADDT